LPVLKNARHERFAQALAKGETADAAYAMAGFSPNRGNATRLNANESVVARVAEILGKAADKAGVTQEMVMRELAKIGFSDIRKAVKWGEGIGVIHPESGEIVIANGVSLIGSDDLDDETAGAIAEVSQTKEGLKVKFYDKKSALVDLGKHLGMFKDEDKKSGDIHIHFDGLLKGVL
jgi:phage terminase small subunit